MGRQGASGAPCEAWSPWSPLFSLTALANQKTQLFHHNTMHPTTLLLAAAALLAASTLHPLPLARAGGLGDAAEGVAAATVGAKCGVAPLDGYYCRVLNDPNANFKGEAGCCGSSTKIIVTPGLIDSRNSTVSYAPKSVEDCNLMCAKNPGCLTASAFSNNGNLFCNMYGPSDCQFAR